MKIKALKFYTKIIGAFCAASVLSANVFSQPTDLEYLFKYHNIGIRDLGAPSFVPFAASAVQAITYKFNFVSPNGSGSLPPYYSDVTQTGDVAFLEGNWGTITQSTSWLGYTSPFTVANGNYIECVPSTNCNKTDKKALFAIIKFNNDWIDYAWDNYVLNKNQIINGHYISKNDIRQYLVAHELGHVLGMGHEAAGTCQYNPPPIANSLSVMEAGAWCNPLYVGYSSADLVWINSRY